MTYQPSQMGPSLVRMTPWLKRPSSTMAAQAVSRSRREGSGFIFFQAEEDDPAGSLSGVHLHQRRKQCVNQARRDVPPQPRKPEPLIERLLGHQARSCKGDQRVVQHADRPGTVLLGANDAKPVAPEELCPALGSMTMVVLPEPIEEL